MISGSKSFSRRAGAFLLVGTVLGGAAAPLLAQTAPAAQPPVSAQPQPALATAPAAPVERVIRSIAVKGNQRLEPETIRAYANLSPGQTYTAGTLDQALKDLYATQLFADVTINGGDTGDLVINVRENPVINRIILEGNKRLKDDKITPEIKLAPRQIFTRSAARSDVDRILELYRRQGRFAARVEPKIVQLDQNRVDVVFEVQVASGGFRRRAVGPDAQRHDRTRDLGMRRRADSRRCDHCRQNDQPGSNRHSSCLLRRPGFRQRHRRYRRVRAGPRGPLCTPFSPILAKPQLAAPSY